jgi:Flp pilus assembly protein TadD
LDDELKKMRAAAETARTIDPLLAETFDALGLADARDGHWKPAEANFLRAIELNPNRTETYMDYYFSLLRVLGRHSEAVKQLRIAQKNDPLSIRVQTMLANTLLSDHRYDDAAELCLKIPGNDEVKRQDLARARLGQGRSDEAIQILLSSVAAQPENAQFRGLLGYAYARSGRREDAEKMAAADSKYANERALIFAGLGDKERTLNALEGMAVLGAQRVGTYLDYPEFDLLRGDPRVKALRQRVGLPE